MNDEMQKAGLPAPDYRTQNIFTLILTRPIPANDTLNDTLKNNNEQQTTQLKTNGTLNGTLIFTLHETPGLSAYELTEKTGKSYRTVMRSIKQLIDAGLIERRGGKKKGGYYAKTPNH
jgi:predicted HTH transcriptional regulator